MHREVPGPASGPQPPGDLPPLPSKHYRPRPRFACPHCRGHFVRAEELEAHLRRGHPDGAAEGRRRHA